MQTVFVTLKLAAAFGAEFGGSFAVFYYPAAGGTGVIFLYYTLFAAFGAEHIVVYRAAFAYPCFGGIG